MSVVLLLLGVLALAFAIAAYVWPLYVIGSTTVVTIVGVVYLVLVKKWSWRLVSVIIKAVRYKLSTERNIAKGILIPDLWASTLTKVDTERNAIVDAPSGHSVTFQEVEDMSNRVAHWYSNAGFGTDDVVALIMHNRPEFFPIWLGIAKAGGRTALINHNLRDEALSHSIRCVNTRVVILDANVAEQVATIESDLGSMDLFHMFTPSGASCSVAGSNPFEDVIREQPAQPLPKAKQAKTLGVTPFDPALYIYTSGTTGLPKAAIVRHARWMRQAYIFQMLLNIGTEDVVYCPLPFYHTAGGTVGVGQMVVGGATLVSRAKFSASRFTDEIRKYNCTVMQYIGELCRYLTAQPAREEEKDNKLRLAVGNGLRPDVWNEFQTRWNIPQIAEFYGATEGTGGLVNLFNVFGSVGWMPWQVPGDNRLVRFDPVKEEPVRGPDGYCINCDVDEPGEFLSQVVVKGGKYENYAGYSNSEATNKKLIRDVFTKGDLWFRSGDLLKRDADGNCFFVDRVGATFRWKGENCSTQEVSQQLLARSSVDELMIYGVRVGNLEGRAAMATLVSCDPSTFDWKEFAEAVRSLPSYSRPLFLRFLPLDTPLLQYHTSTFKQRHVDLQREGFDPAQVSDPLFFWNGKEYVPLDHDLHQRIVSGSIRL